MNTLSNITIVFTIGLLLTSCKEKAKEETILSSLVEEVVNYQLDSTNMVGYIAYDKNLESPRPGIMVVHEWWGLNEYAKRRARELAELGYVAMALDMYGDGKTADNPQDAGALATPFYQNPAMAKSHFDAAMNKLKSFSQVDPNRMAAIGYCFGGSMVLNMARMGEDLDAVVSFHGNLLGVPLDKDILKANVLVLHGNDDQFVPATEVETFKRQMDSIGANYTFIGYPESTHAFTNPDATATGQKYGIPIAYNAKADTLSFKMMENYFKDIFKK